MCGTSALPGLLRPGVLGLRVAVSVSACGRLYATLGDWRCCLEPRYVGGGGIRLGGLVCCAWVLLFLFRGFPLARMVLLLLSRFPIFSDLGKQSFVFTYVRRFVFAWFPYDHNSDRFHMSHNLFRFP